MSYGRTNCISWSILDMYGVLVSSFIEEFLFSSFQQQNEIKKGKYPLNGIQILSFLREQMNLFDVKMYRI